MGKKTKTPKFQLPDKPGTPVVVQDRYTIFYREQLLRDMREDFESFPEGLPTYHSYVQKVVESHADQVADAQQLGVKDLSNFLKGLKSHVPKIKVLDAYMQIVSPKRSKGFRADRHSKYIGEAIANYLGSPNFSGAQYDRAQSVENLKGIYKLRSHSNRRGIKKPDQQPPRFLALVLSETPGFLLAYEFNCWPTTTFQDDRSELLKLVTGICVPQPTSALIVQRDYRFWSRRLGKLAASKKATQRAVLGENDTGRSNFTFRMSVLVSDDEKEFKNRFEYFAIVNHKEEAITIIGDEVEDEYTINSIIRRINLLGGFI